MKAFTVRRSHLYLTFMATVVCFTLQQTVGASPFGAGVFGEDVPFGSATSIGVSIDADADMNLAPSGPNFSGHASHTVTVTSTDVEGYQLFVNADTTTSMENGAATIPASANSTPSTLATNTWGYNTSGSTTNFIGMELTQSLLHSASGPYKDGDDTTITYGALADITKPSGTYTVDVTYTAVGDS